MLQSTFYMNSVNLGPGTKKNGLKFVILMCPDHLRNWLEFGHILSMFLIWVQFWLHEMRHMLHLQLQCGAVIILSIFSWILTKDTP